MIRSIAFAAMLAMLPLGAAAQGTAGYVAVPTVPSGKPTFIARSTAFTWRDGAYVAPRAPERARIMCELVAKEVGALSSFSAEGQTLDAEALARCNARAAR